MVLRSWNALVLGLGVVCVFSLVRDVAGSGVVTGAGCAMPTGSTVAHKAKHDEDKTNDKEDPEIVSVDL